jgi:lipopolysaccharide/colanic/teichoic acid biosynthesis glycosyltransferase
MRETLNVLPGLTSPGSLAYFAEEARLPRSPEEAERFYLEEVLPRKIALDLVYVRNRSLRYDTELVIRTAASIVGAHDVFLRRQAWEAAEAKMLLHAEALG